MLRALGLACLVLLVAASAGGGTRVTGPREVTSYLRIWNRDNATILKQLSSATAAFAAGSLTGVAVEAFTVDQALEIKEFSPRAGAANASVAIGILRQAGVKAFAWLLDEADTGYKYNCSMAARLFQPNNTDAFLDSISQRLDAMQADGLVLDLEPQDHRDPACTADLGRQYASFLLRLSTLLHKQGRQLEVYDEGWQWHRIDTFFDFALDGRAAGRVVVGVTYEGPGNFTNASSFAVWKQRFDWLTSPAVIPDPLVLACGLSTDSVYDETSVSDRLGAISSAGVTAVHVFALPVPLLWLKPLATFLSREVR